MKFVGEQAAARFVTMLAWVAICGCKEKPVEHPIQDPPMTAAEKSKAAIKDVAVKTGDAVKDTAVKGWEATKDGAAKVGEAARHIGEDIKHEAEKLGDKLK